MRPVLAHLDEINHRLRYAKASPKLPLRNFASQALDLFDCFCRKFGGGIPFAKLRRRITTSATLSSHVRHVLAMGAEPQMLGVHTGGIVAGMADEHSFRDWAFMALKRDAMGLRDEIALPIAAIALAVAAASPFPTAVFLLGDEIEKGVSHEPFPSTNGAFVHAFMARHLTW